MKHPSLITIYASLALILHGYGAVIAAETPAPLPSASSTANTPPLTPDSAVALAIANHPLLRAAQGEIEGAQADVRLAHSGYLPHIDLSEDLVRSTNPVFVFASKLGQERFGPADFAIDALNTPDPFTNGASRVSVRQNIWDGGRTILGGKAADAGVRASSLARDRTREQIAYGALVAFWNAVLADEMTGVARAAETAARANVDLASAQVDAGLAVPSDRMSAEVRLAEIRALVIRADAGVARARAALRQALGITANRPFTLAPPTNEFRATIDPPDSANAASPPPTARAAGEALLADAVASRPDLLALDERLEQARLGEKIARSHYLPDIGAGGQYEWNGSSAFGSLGSNWTVGVSLRIPLFDGLENSARRARARADRERLEALRQAASEGIRLEVSAAWADRSSARERLVVSESAVRLAEEAHRIVSERYGEGLAVMVELLGAEAALTDARGRAILAEHDLALATAALDLATGRVATGPLATQEEP